MVDPAANNIQELQSADEERDLGIAVHNQCKFRSNCKKTVSHANSVLAFLKKTISSRYPYVLVKMYKAIVRQALDFGICIASPG